MRRKNDKANDTYRVTEYTVRQKLDVLIVEYIYALELRRHVS